jgi:hypothetical protein
MKGDDTMKNNKQDATYNGAFDIQKAFIDIVILNKRNRDVAQVGKAHIDFLDELDK